MKIIVFPSSMCVCVCLLMYMPASISDLCIGVRVGVFFGCRGVCLCLIIELVAAVVVSDNKKTLQGAEILWLSH